MGEYARNRILLTNDDGIDAPGLTSLVAKLAEFCEVYVCCPERRAVAAWFPQSPISRERSANSHCITLGDAINVLPANVPGAKAAFSTTGTPADCVMLALSGPVFTPQLAGSMRLVVSGINRGHNAGLHVVYSGTVAAAREAANIGVPAIAVSLDTFDRAADYKPAVSVVAALVHDLLEYGDLAFIRGYVLNVNIPNRKREDMRGFLVTRQSTECTQPRFVENPIPDEARRAGRRSYRNVSGGLRQDRPRGSDAWALEEGFVAVSFLGSMSAVNPPASVAIGPRVEGERPASLDATSSAAVGRLIGDLETMRRHVDALGRAKRENFSLEDALGFDAAAEAIIEVSHSVANLCKNGGDAKASSGGLNVHGSAGSQPRSASGYGSRVFGMLESAIGFLASPSQWGDGVTSSCAAPPSPSGSFRSSVGDPGSRAATPLAGQMAPAAFGSAHAPPQRRTSFEQAVAGAGLGFPFGEGGGRGRGAAGAAAARGPSPLPGSPLRPSASGANQQGAAGASGQTPAAPSAPATNGADSLFAPASPVGPAQPGASFGGFSSASKAQRDASEGSDGGGLFGTPGGVGSASKAQRDASEGGDGGGLFGTPGGFGSASPFSDGLGGILDRNAPPFGRGGGAAARTSP